MNATRLTMFSWGYEGWGSSTRQLKQAVDVVEKARGYEAPFFVDIRMQRSGYAPEFVGNLFEKTLGRDRYRWMKSLGNKSIVTRTGGLQINEPEAVEELLGLALARNEKQRRVIFFCSCGLPRDPAKNRTCHRVEVGRLLLRIAKRRNVHLTIEEWPGGRQKLIRKTISDEEARKLRKGQKNLPLGDRRPSSDLLGLPWASVIAFKSPNDSFRALADPACFRGSQWMLPLPVGIADDSVSPADLWEQSAQNRRKHRFEPRENVGTG